MQPSPGLTLGSFVTGLIPGLILGSCHFVSQMCFKCGPLAFLVLNKPDMACSLHVAKDYRAKVRPNWNSCETFWGSSVSSIHLPVVRRSLINLSSSECADAQAGRASLTASIKALCSYVFLHEPPPQHNQSCDGVVPIISTQSSLFKS